MLWNMANIQPGVYTNMLYGFHFALAPPLGTSWSRTLYPFSISDKDTEYRCRNQYRNSRPHLQAHLDLAVDVTLIDWLLLERNRLAHLLWNLFKSVAAHETHATYLSKLQ